DRLFNSLTFSGSGYTVSELSNRIIVGGGGILNFATSGTNRYNGPIRFAGQRDIGVASGGSLELGGVLSGGSSLGGVHITKTGLGVLTLNGPDANTYTGLMDVTGGLLQLGKGAPGQTAIAIPGDLRILSSAVSDTEVRLLLNNQIADNATVTVTQTS